MADPKAPKFVLTNTLTGRREPFKTLVPGKVLFYSCGPTVYGPLHIGNARALVVADLLYRWLKRLYGEGNVQFVRNYTDVDDKIIARAKEEKIPAAEVARKYIDYCEADMKMLDLQAPVRTVTVTESMVDIVGLIQKIIDRGHAYVVEGEVLFAIDSFAQYGKLSGKNVEELQAGARVEVDPKKRNPMDFALWKPAKPGEPSWDSPWSRGRPGWHIECSAMVGRWLGETIDLHHGGQDLIFPHHENEIAQSEAGTGKPFCGHWVHHAFITSGAEKMSKSLGNILPMRQFIEQYGAELLKYIFASYHYRSPLPYTEEMMNQALNELERAYLTKRWARSAATRPSATASPHVAGTADPWKPLIGRAAQVYERMEDELLADLNTSGALGHLFALIREINRVEQEAGGKAGIPAPSSEGRRTVAAEFVELLERRLHPILNVFGEDPAALLSRIEAIRRARNGAAVPGDDEIRALIEERNDSRKRKNFKRADEIRRDLDARGVVLVDGPQGTTWKAKG